MRKLELPTVFVVFFCAVIASVSAQSPDQSPEKRISLTFLGDIMVHKVNHKISVYSRIYANVSEILKNDALSFANLEFPIDSSRPYSAYPRFNASPDYARAAAEAGIEVFALANNHAYDQGREGVLQTLRSMAALEQSLNWKIYYAGIRGNIKAPFKPVEIRVDGFRLGFLAVTQMVNEYQKFPYVYVVDYQSKKDRETFLKTVREEAAGYDLFILSYHGGKEYALEPDPEKVRFFRRLLQAGVHIVYGHHPHVLQPFELIDTGGRRRLIINSAGNFISGMTWGIDPLDPENPRAYTGDSALWAVEVVFNGGEGSVESVKPIPVSNFLDDRGEMVVDTLSNLLDRELSPKWSSYYRKRFKLIEELLNKQVKQ